MREPIEVNYEPEGEDWQVTVTGRGQTMRGEASGLIAARDRADRLVEEIAPDEEHRTVVHLLNGDALAFTSAYLSARLARPTEIPTGMPEEDPADADRPTDKPTAETLDADADDSADDIGEDIAEDIREDIGDAEGPEVPAPTPSSDQAQKASTS